MIVRACAVVGMLVLGSGCEVAELSPLPQDVSRADTSADTKADTKTDTSEETDEPAEVADDVEGDADGVAEVEPEVADDVDPEVAPEVVDDIAEVAGDVVDETTSLDVGPDIGPEVAPDTTPTCVSTVATFTVEASPHVATCSAVTYPTNPPTSGPHYPVWAAWQSYSLPVPRGHYVHNLEHGGVVFLHNCPSGCEAELQALTAILAARAPDPLCFAPITNRFVVTSDAFIDTRFAVAAWGASMKADCIDPVAINAFIDGHYATGPENFCSQGVDVTNPDVGTPCTP